MSAKPSSSYELVPYGPIFRMIIRDNLQASHIFMDRGQLKGMRARIDALLDDERPKGNRAERRRKGKA